MSNGIIERKTEGYWTLAWSNPNASSNGSIAQGSVALNFDISSYKWGRILYNSIATGYQRQVIEFPLPLEYGGVRLMALDNSWTTASSTAAKYVYHRRITTQSTAIWIGPGMRKLVNDTTGPATNGSGYCVPYNFWVR